LRDKALCVEGEKMQLGEFGTRYLQPHFGSDDNQPTMLRSTSRAYMALLLTLTVAACATRAPYDPFKVPRDQILGRIKTVALMPLQLPQGIEDLEAVRAAFRKLVESRMQAGGFTTIADQEFETRWKRAAEEVGGLYDPMSGKLDVEKFKAVRQKVFRALQSKFGVEGVLDVRVIPALASFGYGVANWDGTRQEIQPGALLLGIAGAYSIGKVGALSFGAWLRDMDDQILFANVGGIQVTSTLSFGGKFLPVPSTELLKDAERNSAAVNLALGQLTGSSTPASVQTTAEGTPTPDSR
jgi:hypothetical protein